MINNLYKSFILVSLLSVAFAGTLGKSHSAELLSRGRSVPMAISDDFLVTAKTFSSLNSRIVDIYSLDINSKQLIKQSELNSPNPLPGDDFGFSIAISSNYMLIGAPGHNQGHGAAYLYKKDSKEWILEQVYDNPVNSMNTGFPHKFGYNVAISDEYLSISSPFYNDGLVYVYNLTSSSSARKSTKPIHTIDVRELGDVEGCYAEGPNKFGFGISTSFQNNKLLIGSLKDFVHLIEFKEGIPFSFDIPNPIIPAEDSIEKSKFGESVYVGDKNIYISALGKDNGKGSVFVYPFISSQRTDENPWSNPYEIQPSDLLENAHFGYKITESDNKVFISTFNQANIYNFNINQSDKLQLVNSVTNAQTDGYFGRNVILKNDLLFTDAYYTDEFFIYDLNSVNRGFSSFSTAGQILSINNKLECSGGLAGGQFPCNEIDLMSFMDKTQIGGLNSTSLNDIWGWTDPQTNKEYALVGMSNGTSFVDISDAENPVYVGRLATQTNNSTWRDIKVYQNHAFIVSEAGGHGMQVFDLKELRNYSGSPITFSNTAFYSEFGNAHNIFINEDTGYAYAVGTSTCGPGGLHIVDISTPSIPSKAACVSDPNVGNERGSVGYNHDVQCVIYNGPDSAYVGKEICFGSTENSVWIADLSTKSDDSTGQKTIGIGTYDDYYTHQGWLTEDHKYFIANDELDENNNAYSNTRTLIWNVEDLSNPTLENTYLGPTPAIDHNNYIIGDKVYMSHYTSGLRVLDISDISSPIEDSFFDVYPSNNNTSFDGTWSNYPYYPSGVIVVSGIDEGLFVLNPSGNEQGQAPTVTYAVPSDGSVTLTWDLIGNSSTKMNIYRAEEEGFTPSSSNLLVSVNYPGVEYTDSSLDSNTFYYYQLSLETNGTVGPFSDEIKVKPIVAPNQPPTIDQPANIEFFEDNQYSLTLTGVGYGSDVNPQNVTISAISDNTDLFSAIEVVESLPQQLALNPLENQYGSATITVTVKDDGGVEDGGVDTTVVTFTATVNPVNDPPSSFNSIGEYMLGSGQYIPGTDFRTLYITPENVNDSIRFVWDSASDVDGDNVQYRMIGYQGLEFLSMTAYTSDSFKTWALKDLVAETDTISVTEGSWNVIATDGQSFNTAIAIGGQLRVDGRQLIPDVLEIKQSYPNPFTTFTTIEYDVPSTQSVVLKIFNIRGQIVKTLVNEDKSPGYYSVVWDGTNDSGDAVSSGVYFCQMHTPKNPNGGQFIKAKKMVKIR